MEVQDERCCSRLARIGLLSVGAKEGSMIRSENITKVRESWQSFMFENHPISGQIGRYSNLKIKTLSRAQKSEFWIKNEVWPTTSRTVQSALSLSLSFLSISATHLSVCAVLCDIYGFCAVPAAHARAHARNHHRLKNSV